MDVILGLLCLLSSIVVAMAGDYCSTDHGTQYQYCSYGCCGDYPNEKCCSVYVWAIILAVIGGIFFISFIIILVCCVYKKKGHNGRVMTSNPGTTVTTVNYMHPGVQPGAQPYGYMQPPPGYQPAAGYQPQPPPGYQPSAGFQPQPPPYSNAYPPPMGFPQTSDSAYPSGSAYPPPPPKY